MHKLIAASLIAIACLSASAQAVGDDVFVYAYGQRGMGGEMTVENVNAALASRPGRIVLRLRTMHDLSGQWCRLAARERTSSRTYNDDDSMKIVAEVEDEQQRKTGETIEILFRGHWAVIEQPSRPSSRCGERARFAGSWLQFEK